MISRESMPLLSSGGNESASGDSELFARALGALPDGIALYGHDGRLIYHNQALVDCLNLGADEVAPGIDFFSLLSSRIDAGGARAAKSSRAQFVSRRTLVLPIRLRDGRRLTCEHRPLGQGQYMRRFCPLDADEADGGLDPQQMQSLLSGSLEGVLVHVDGQVVYVNERLAELLERTADSMIGGRIEPLVHPDDSKRLDELRERSQGQGFEFRALKGDGSPVWFQAFSHAIEWDGRPARKTSVVDIEDAKRAAQTLKESENRLRDFAEAGSDWFWQTDADHVFVDFSKNVEEAVGNPREILLGKRRTDLIVKPRHPDAKTQHLRLLEARLPFKDFIYQTGGPGDTLIWLRVSGQPFFDEDGRFLGYRGVGSNITAQIEEQESAQRSRELLLTAIDNAPNGIALYDADDKLVFANEAYRRMDMRHYDLIVPGLKFEELLRLRLQSGFLTDAVGTEEEWLNRRMEQHRDPGSAIILRQVPDLWWLVAEQRLPDRGTVVAITNITAQKQAELALSASEQRFRDLVDGSPQGILIHRDETVVYANEASAKLHGFSQDELIGKNIYELAFPDDRAALVQRRAKRLAGEAVEPLVHYRTLLKDGSVRWVELAGRSIEWEGQPARQIIETDITERHLGQEALRSAKEQAEQANRVKSQFLANMSHELRTPLNAIVGFSDMIEQQLLGPIHEPRYVEYAHDINASGQHLLAIINDILDLSRIEAGQSDLEEAEFELEDAVASCMRLIGSRAKAAKVALSVELAAHIPRVFADERRIKQILINLLSNAVKFTPADGKVAVRAKRATDGGLLVEVTDTGIGMASEDIARAMRPFVQLDTSLSRKFEGTGLGLALSKKLADMHQAELSIDSTPGEGTCVSLKLPRERMRDIPGDAQA